MKNLRDALSKLSKNKQNAIIAYPAQMGDGLGRVIAGAGLVYVRIGSVVTIAACTTIPPVHDLSVWVGYDPIEPSVLKVLGQRDATGSQNYVPSVGAHAAMHEFLGAGSIGGTDIIKVQLPQFMPLAVWPHQGLKVIIYPGVVWIGNQYKLIADINAYGKPVPKVIDFTEYPAPSINKEMYYLIGIDGNGNIQVVAGNQVDLGTITLNDIPEATNLIYKLAAIRRTFDQEAIVINRESTDIVDLRFPIAHKHTESDLPNNALKIAGYDVDVSDLNTGEVLVFDGTKFVTESVGGGSEVYWYVDGYLESGNTIVRSYVVTRSMTIQKVFMALENLGSSGTTTIDIRKNNTTIFAVNNQPSLAYNSNTAFISVVPAVTNVSEGDILTLYIVSAADAAKGLSVVIDFGGGSSSGNSGSSSGNSGSVFDSGIDSPQHWPSSQYNEEFEGTSLSNDWITINMGNNTYYLKNSALVVNLTGVNNFEVRCLAKPIPPGYWRCYAKFGMSANTNASTSDWISVGLTLYDSNTGRLALIWNNRSRQYNELAVGVEFFNSPNSFNSVPAANPCMFYFHPYFVIAKKSSGWDFGYSADGVEFNYLLYNYNLTFLTPNYIGIICRNWTSGATSVFNIQWMRFEIL